MDYKYIFSTVVGVVIILLLITFCMDVAVRSIKLAMLQLIAPIPIISYVDPKSGKDGMFKKWYQMCFKTYLSLFIRLLALYFAVYIISRVADMKLIDVVDGSYQTNAFVSIFIIIGALMFAKQFPDILKNLGINLDGGGFTLNPLKKVEKDAIGGKQILGAAKGTAAAGLAGAAAFGTNAIATKGNIFKRLGSGISGATSATGRGLWSTVKGKKAKEVFTNSYGAANLARRNRDDRQELGVNSFDVAKTRMQHSMGITTQAQQQDVQIKRYDEVLSASKAAKSRAESEIDKKADKIITDSGETLGALRDKVEILKSSSINRSAYSDDGAYQAAVEDLARRTSEANAEYFGARKKVTNKYVESAASGNLVSSFVDSSGNNIFADEDVIVQENVKKAQSAAEKYSLTDKEGRRISVETTDIGKSIQSFDDAKTTIESSDEFRTAHLIEEQAKKEKK